MNKFTTYWNDITGLAAEREQSAKDREQFSHDVAALQGAVQYLVEEAYWEGPMSITPDSVLSHLGELDSGLIDELVNRRQWDILGGLSGSFMADSEMARKRAIDDSRYLYIYNPLVDWMIKVWTNYGMGDSVQVSVNHAEGDIVFQEFWGAERNQSVLGDDNLQYQSVFTLQDGNTFWACFGSKADGLTTIEELPVDEVVDIICNPERKSEHLFYKRSFDAGNGVTKTIYYPDWAAKFSGKLTPELVNMVLPKGYIRADEKDLGDVTLNDIEAKLGTDVVIIHVAHNKKSRSSPWGWPLVSSTAYIKAHKKFMEDRLTVSASKAMYVRRKQVEGGSRAVDSIKSTIASRLSRTSYSDQNPAAGAGSIEIDNMAVKTSDLPMTTGASDAKNDHEMFSWIALLSGGIFPTTAGMDTSRWATALAMDKTLAMQWSRYQTFWAAQFERLVYVVLKFAELYGGYSFIGEDGNSDYSAQVNIDTLSLVDFPDVVTSLSQATRDMLLPYMTNGVISDQTGKSILRELWMIMLQALGLTSSGEIASKEAFGIIDETEGKAPLPPEQVEFMKEIREAIASGSLDGLAEILETTING